jgi:hypothetical protein
MFYRDLQHTMNLLMMQVQESVPFMRSFLTPDVLTPYDLYRFLKSRTVYTLDPPDRELIQSSKTLFKKNYHGTPGAGDCDCFTVTVTAACIVLQIPVEIVLAGRRKDNAVHIYNLVTDPTYNEPVPFDLTQPEYASERFYKFRYCYPIKVKNRSDEKFFHKNLLL